MKLLIICNDTTCNRYDDDDDDDDRSIRINQINNDDDDDEKQQQQNFLNNFVIVSSTSALFCKKFSKNNVNIVHRTSSSSYTSASFRSFQTSFFIWMFIVVCLGPLLSCKFFRFVFFIGFW